jgi:7-cyano-7-deazaguanine synthase
VSFNEPKIQSNAIVLFSGGMDSTTLLYYAKQIHNQIYAVTFDYNQRHRKEIDHAKQICEKIALPFEIIKLTIPVIKGSPLIDTKTDVPSQSDQKQEITVIPLRNSLFLLHASIHALKISVTDIYIAAVAEDQTAYLDCRAAFFNAFQKLLNVQDIDINIRYPFVNKTKAELVKIGEVLEVPWNLTWTCYKGKDLACGVCDACKERLEAFKQNGLKDPIKYE